MSKAFSLFDATTKRALDVFNLSAHWYFDCPNTKDADDNKPVYEDMARGGLVLAVAAMDEYFTRRFSELLIPYIKKKGSSKDLSVLLSEAGLDVAQALELVLMERPLRRVRAIVDAHLDRYTAQRFVAIDSLFRCIGLPSLSEDAQRLAGRKTLKRSIEILVERRHAIVHAGDYDKHGHLVTVDFRKFRNRIDDLRIFVAKADEIIAKVERSLKQL
jgi:hypothetical protein